MDNKIQEELRAIQTEAFAKFCGELLKHNANPQSLFAAELAGRVAQEAIASLTSLINREVVRELEDIPPIPTFLYTTRHDPKKLKESMGRANAACVHIYNRIKTLTPGGSDNETN